MVHGRNMAKPFPDTEEKGPDVYPVYPDEGGAEDAKKEKQNLFSLVLW